MRSVNTHYLARLDCLRFLAAAMVVLYHTTWQLYPNLPGVPNPWPKLNWFNAFYLEGTTGVSLFIVMSGFLMTMIYDISPGIRYSDFIYNRFLRVIPLTAVFFFGSLAVFQKEITFASNEVINFLTLQFNADHRYSIAPIWTVAVEFQFYLLFPVLFAIKRKKGMLILAGMCAMFGVLRFLLITKAVISSQTGAYNVVYTTLIGRIDQFVIGMFLYHLYARNPDKKNWFHLPIAIVVVGLYIYFHRQIEFWRKDLQAVFIDTWILTLEAFVWGYFIYAVLTFSKTIPFQRTLAFLGQASFSMYLWHWLILEAYIRYLHPTKADLISTGLIALAITTVVSLGSFYCIEKPFLEFKRRYTQ